MKNIQIGSCRFRCIHAHCSAILIVLLVNLFFLYFLHFHQLESFSLHHTVTHRVVLAIQSDWKNIRTLVNASQNTWIPLLHYDLFYFVGMPQPNDSHLFNHLNIITLAVDDNVYPSVEKTFAIWSYFFNNHLETYDYFIVIDSDTYVNVKLLEEMIRNVTCHNCYIGSSAIGQSFERATLDLRAPYCVGMGYIISRYTLSQFGPHIDNCQRSIVARHSDTELGRCIYRYAHGLSCQPPIIPFERVLNTLSKSQKIVGVKYNARHQMLIDFPQSPPTKFFQAAMIHPLKEARFFYHFHRQVTLGLRPVLPFLFAQNSCVANPIIQEAIYHSKRFLPECPSARVQQSFHLTTLPTFVITLHGHDQHLSQLIDAFGQHGILVKRFWAQTGPEQVLSQKLTRGAVGLRLTMARFFTMAMKENLTRVLVLEDDAIPHRHLGIRLSNLLNESRCGGYLQDDQTGGVLMLGATIWNAGWNSLLKRNNFESGSCRNIGKNIFGSFAVIYHHHTYETILTWLTKKNNDPFDFVFVHLARLGYPVRLALPNLVITDVVHKSRIQDKNITSYHHPEQRARIHRWKLNDYMFKSYSSSQKLIENVNITHTD